MKRWSVLVSACVGLATLGRAQPAQVQINADCVVQFNITTSGGTSPTTGGFDNRRIGCNSWQISYANNGFSVISLAIQEAPDSSGTPGSWGTLTGTLTFGVNPNTNITGASSLVQSYGTNFAPWVRVALTSATGSGSVVGILLGYRAAGSAGTSSTVTSNVTITGPLGQSPMASGVAVTLPNNQTAGCTRATPVNLASSGNTVLVAGSASKQIYICEIQFATGSAEDVKLTEGTTAACAMGNADVTGLYKGISTFDFGNGFMALQYTATAGDSLCINQSASQAAGVTVWYIQQ